MSAPILTLVPGADAPDLFVKAADGAWCPAYQMRDRVIDGVYRTTFYVHHADGVAAVTPARLNTLAEEGRVLAPSAFGSVIAVVDDDETPAPKRPASARLRDLDETGPDRWERLRRLLNARCGQYSKHTGEDADATRHGAAGDASGHVTVSSMDLTEDEMENAVSYVEHLLWEAGFDLDAADAEYRARRAARAGGAAPLRRAA